MENQLADWEISLIKGMLRLAKHRGLSNQDVVSFFSTPERSINQGRITEIQQGNIRYSSVPEARATDVIRFMEDYPQQELNDYLNRWEKCLAG